MSSKLSSKFAVIIAITSLFAASLACASQGKGQDGNPSTEVPLSTTTASAASIEATTISTQPEQPPVEATPEPTQEPPPAQPSSDKTRPDIGNINTSDNRVHYDKQICGATKIGFEVRVTDNVAVESVWIQYRFNGAVTGGSISNWKTASFVKQDNTNIYTLLLDAQDEPKTVLNGSNGLMEYQVFARDFAGNTAEYPNGSVLGIQVVACK